MFNTYGGASSPPFLYNENRVRAFSNDSVVLYDYFIYFEMLI